MREQKKVLKLKKFKVARLNSNHIIGGTGDPVNDTTGTHQASDTQDYDCNQHSVPLITCTTVSEVRTELQNGCTDNVVGGNTQASEITCRP